MGDRPGKDPLERLGDARRQPEEMTRTFEGDDLERMLEAAEHFPFGPFTLDQSTGNGTEEEEDASQAPGPFGSLALDQEGPWADQLRQRLRTTGYSEPRLLASGSPRSRIYLSRHVDLDLTVAVKVFLPAKKPGFVWRGRFLREGRAAGKVNHPHVLRLLGGGQLADAAYLIYEHCAEGSLAERLLLAPPTLRYAVRLVSQMVQGLQAIHDAGYLHLDIKPSNILIAEGGLPKLADLGLGPPAGCPRSGACRTGGGHPCLHGSRTDLSRL